MDYEKLVTLLKRAKPEHKAEAIGNEVRRILNKHDSGTQDVRKRRFDSYAADVELSKLVRAEREAQHGKGY
jgi:hypothetical protein